MDDTFNFGLGGALFVSQRESVKVQVSISWRKGPGLKTDTKKKDWNYEMSRRSVLRHTLQICYRTCAQLIVGWFKPLRSCIRLITQLNNIITWRRCKFNVYSKAYVCYSVLFVWDIQIGNITFLFSNLRRELFISWRKQPWLKSKHSRQNIWDLRVVTVGAKTQAPSLSPHLRPTHRRTVQAFAFLS